MTVRPSDAFPVLSDAHLDRLRALGTERDVAAGEVLFHEGDRGYDFFVVLDGRVAVYADGEGRYPLAESIRAGQFIGEMGLLLGWSIYATARVEEAGRVLQVPAARFRDLLNTRGDFAAVVLPALVARREMTREGGGGLTLIGSRTDPAALRLAEFGRRNYLPLHWLDLETEADEAARLLERYGYGGVHPSSGGPFVLWGSSTLLADPSTLDVARVVGIDTEPPGADLVDLLVVGAGPAGLAAAVYGASEGLRTVVVDGIGVGGQAGSSSRIENYLGFPAGLSGTELATRAILQARKFGATFVTPRCVSGLRHDGSVYVAALDDGPAVRARAVVVATGARYRRLPLENLSAFEGAGVYYAATETEARVCGGATVLVVGGGNSAGQAALFLAERSDRVLLLLRGGDLRKGMSSYLADRVEAADAVEVRLETEVRALHGGAALTHVDLEHTPTGACETVGTPALFVFIGADPETGWLSDVALDAKGFVLTGPDVPWEALDPDPWGDARPSAYETNWPGLYAVGDVRSGSTKRVAGAVGEGSVVVKAVHARFDAGEVAVTR